MPLEGKGELVGAAESPVLHQWGKWTLAQPATEQSAEECIIYSAARSSPQPLDLCLLSPGISAYTAVRGAPDPNYD